MHVRALTAPVAVAAAVVIWSCGSGIQSAKYDPSQTVEQPPATADPTAGEHDWEKPPSAPADERFEDNNFRPNEYNSSRSLGQTTNWLHWAILRYGSPDDPRALPGKTIDVKFNGCSMQWIERTPIDAERAVDKIDALNLANVNLSYGDITASPNQLQLQGMRGLQETEQFYTISGGTLERDGDPRQTGEMIAYIRLNHRDHIENRIAWALIHAAKLCGAKAY